MDEYKKLEISTKNAAFRIQEILRVLNDRFSNIVFYAEISDTTDLQLKEFCEEMKAISQFASGLKQDPSMDEMIRKKFAELPSFREEEFVLGPFQIPTITYYLFLPLGLWTWFIRYRQLQAIRDKLGAAYSTINTGLLYLQSARN